MHSVARPLAIPPVSELSDWFSEIISHHWVNCEMSAIVIGVNRVLFFIFNLLTCSTWYHSHCLILITC